MAKAKTTAETPASQKRHRTLPIPSSITHIRGYPTKLFIYQLEASKYWWVRYFAAGKTLRKSTKKTSKQEAIEFAKTYFFEVGSRVENGIVVKETNFASCAKGMMKEEAAKLKRNELTKVTYDNLQYRLDKLVLPYFMAKDVTAIDYFEMSNYLGELSDQEPKMSLSTIAAYMGVVRKVLSYAARRSFIKGVPEFPKVAKKDAARGWFNTAEYRRLWVAANRYIGTVVEHRRWKNDKGEFEYQFVKASESESFKRGELLRNIEMTEDLRRLVVFMVNSYIRPTDIKFMQHKHVDVVRGEHVYLRLRIPTTKKHNKPITTMQKAVEVYETLKAYHAKNEMAGPDDYVFLPQYSSRDYALKQLQRQFEVLMWATGLGAGMNGEERTLYSLRHTCIMYRLIYGDGINTLLLARNARTSVEMIDRFYAAPLTGEMNIKELQSRRRKRKIFDGYVEDGEDGGKR